MTNDRRTNGQRNQTAYFVNCTDSFMSGWGHAPGKSYYCVACPDMPTAQEVESRMYRRDEFKRVAISINPRRGGAQDHTSISWHTDFSWQPN